jgi:hypothetical protein
MTTALAVRRTLDSAEVEFIDENGAGPGVRAHGAQEVNSCESQLIGLFRKSASGPRPAVAKAPHRDVFEIAVAMPIRGYCLREGLGSRLAGIPCAGECPTGNRPQVGIEAMGPA